MAGENKDVVVLEPTTLDNEMIKVIEASGLERSQAEQVLEGFKLFFEEAKSYELEAKAIVITDATQVSEMKRARELRLKLKNIRVNAEKVRVQRKEFFLRGGKAVDGIANVLKAVVVPLEEYLDKQENFAERMEAERKQELADKRTEELRPYVSAEMLAVYIPGLKDMTAGAFDILLANSKKAFEDQKKAEEEAEAKRKADEEAKRIEDERIRKENEDLKKEAEEKEKLHAEEMKKVEAEKAEAERVRLEEKKKSDAEKAEAEERERKALADKKAAEDELKRKQEEEDRKKAEAEAAAKKEAEEKAKMERAKKYKEFRASHGYTEESKDDFYEKVEGGKVSLFKKVGEFTL